MTKAKQQAILDIKEDLKRNHKCFLAFHSELDPVMESLVNQQIKAQSTTHHNPLPSLHKATKTNSQLVAHCFFAKGEIHYENYDKYYKK